MFPILVVAAAAYLTKSGDVAVYYGWKLLLADYKLPLAPAYYGV